MNIGITSYTSYHPFCHLEIEQMECYNCSLEQEGYLRDLQTRWDVLTISYFVQNIKIWLAVPWA